MILKLYRFSKRINSTARPKNTHNELIIESYKLKDDTSLFNPVFTTTNIKTSSCSIADYTYCVWGSKYYYIDDIIFKRQNYIELRCSIDVLATYIDSILNTVSYVSYSTRGYNSTLTDSRLSTVSTPSVEYTKEFVFNHRNPDVYTNPTFIVSYITSHPTVGTAGVVNLGPAEALQLMNVLTVGDFSDWLNNHLKEMSHVYDAILSSAIAPFSWALDASVDSSRQIFLGSWNSGVSGYIPQIYIKKTDINIPWQYEKNDPRNGAEYTSLFLFLPAYGFIGLNASDFIGKDTLQITSVVDAATGSCEYIINDVTRATTTLAIPMAMGSVRGNYTGLLDSTFSGASGWVSSALAAGLATTGIGAVAASIAGAVGVAGAAIGGIKALNQRDLGTTGSTGSFASFYAHPLVTSPSTLNEWYNVVCYTIVHKTINNSVDFETMHGRPTNKVLQLAALVGGFCQTVGASVDVSNQDAASKINSMLDRGVFLEA